MHEKANITSYMLHTFSRTAACLIIIMTVQYKFMKKQINQLYAAWHCLDFNQYLNYNVYLSSIVHKDETVVVSNEVADGSIRLVGGTGPHEGRVEIHLFAHWGTVCNNSWDLVDAAVVCHQLGYPTAKKASFTTAAAAANDMMPIWYDKVACTGYEASLTKCSSTNLGDHTCTHNRDAGVVCGSEL